MTDNITYKPKLTKVIKIAKTVVLVRTYATLSENRHNLWDFIHGERAAYARNSYIYDGLAGRRPPNMLGGAFFATNKLAVPTGIMRHCC